MIRPNLFDFATSELSQDAFLCYLSSFAKEEYKDNTEEYNLANKFLKEILERCNIKDTKIENLEIRKQYLNIDVLLIINKKYYIIIEDKINACEGDNQVNRYYQKLSNEVKSENIRTVYLKTGDESYYYLTTKGVNCIYLRKDMLKLKESYKGKNIIINDYFSNLQNIQDIQDNFKNKNLKTDVLNWNEITGFYNALDNEFSKNILPYNLGFSWYYVPNPNGGFLCYCFYNIIPLKNFIVYLQFESNGISEKEKNDYLLGKNLKLVVKVHNDEKTNKYLYPIFDIFKSEWKDKIAFTRSKSFRSGYDMSLLTISPENSIALNDNGTINIKKTVDNTINIIKEIKNLEDKFKKITL
ncbi:PD-(D/E)XK nuclease family protein [Fusobacterium sp.]|uniref:PD-(D/E)XK nuclease family protein n=1 Tax=Fusobacterium sp. TaxID=68766 RepID=UPI00260F8C5A|nr:PD-(D/E)XK nuclease family protein [Fusobacterium sp.]